MTEIISLAEFAAAHVKHRSPVMSDLHHALVLEIERISLIEAGIHAALLAGSTSWTVKRIELNQRSRARNGWMFRRGDQRLMLTDADMPSWVPNEHLTAHAKAVTGRMLEGFWSGYGYGKARERERALAAQKAVTP